MRMTFKQLKHLPVETKSGILLGHVYDCVMDIDSQMIVQYVVRSSMIRGDEYLVSRDQVISITEEKMIVDDDIKKVEPDIAQKTTLQMSSNPAAFRVES